MTPINPKEFSQNVRQLARTIQTERPETADANYLGNVVLLAMHHGLETSLEKELTIIQQLRDHVLSAITTSFPMARLPMDMQGKILKLLPFTQLKQMGTICKLWAHHLPLLLVSAINEFKPVFTECCITPKQQLQGDVIGGLNWLMRHPEAAEKLEYADFGWAERISMEFASVMEFLLPNLKHLSLKNIKVFGGKEIRFQNLQKLNLSGWSGYRIRTINILAHLPKLRKLVLDNCRGLVSIENLDKTPELRKLVLDNCRELISIENLDKTPELVSLNLRMCKSLMPGSINHLSKLSLLTSLKMFGCSDHMFPSYDLNPFPILKKLEIPFRRSQESGHLLFLSTSLTCLHLEALSPYTERDLDKSIESLQNVPHLTTLVFRGRLSSADRIVRSLDFLQFLPQLKKLGIPGCTFFAPDALKELVHVPLLESLDITFCTQFHNPTTYLDLVPRLTSLRVFYTRIDLKKLEQYQKVNPHLIIEGKDELRALDSLKRKSKNDE